MTGNSLGRAPLGRSDTEATIVWMEGEIVGNSLGRFGESSVGKERDGKRQ